MRHPVAGLNQRKTSTYSCISQLNTIFGLAEVNFLIVRLPARGQCGFRRCRGGKVRKGFYILRCKPEHAHRASDVLHSLLTEVSESYRELIPNLVVRRPRDTHAAGLAERFQTRGDIDAVTKYVVAVDDDIADVDADPKDDLLFPGNRSVAPDHAALNIYGATYRIDHARKFYQHAIAGSFDNAATVFRDGWINQLATV